MGIAIGHRGGVPLKPGHRNGIKSRVRSQGIPFYSPLPIYVPNKFLFASVIIRFSALPLLSQIPIPDGHVSANTLVRFSQTGALGSSFEPVFTPSIGHLYGSATLFTQAYGEISGEQRLAATASIGFTASATSANNVVAGLFGAASLCTITPSGNLQEKAAAPVNISGSASIQFSVTGELMYPPPAYFEFLSSGTGLGYIRLNFMCRNDTLISVDGNGKLYTSHSPEIGETTEATAVSGMDFGRYFKITSGVSRLKFHNGHNLVTWGDVNTTGGGRLGFGRVFDISANVSNAPTFRNLIGYRSVPNLETFNHSGQIAFDLTGLPQSVRRFYIGGTGSSIAGNIADLPSQIQVAMLWDGNTLLTGNVSELPSTIKGFVKSANNKLYGNFITEGLEYVASYGASLVSGFISDWPTTLKSMYQSSGLWYGDISDLPSGMTNLSLSTGNYIGGNLRDLPAGMLTLSLSGKNTVYGDLLNIPSSMQQFTLGGSNSVSGEIPTMPLTMTSFTLLGNNTVTGNLQAFRERITQINIQGYNQLTGSLSDAPSGCLSLTVRGDNQISDYTAGHKFANTMWMLDFNPALGYGLDSTEVDNVLIDANNSLWSFNRLLRLQGGNAPRTSASDSAVSGLIAKGVTLYLNS